MHALSIGKTANKMAFMIQTLVITGQMCTAPHLEAC